MRTESRTRLAVVILGFALGMGLLADLVFRGRELGMNVTVWFAALVGALFLAKRVGGGSLEFGSVPLIAPMVLFAACFAWRDSTTLQALDLGAIILAAALVITRQSGALWIPSLRRVATSVLNLAAHCIAGFAHLVARDIDWTQQRNAAVASNARGAATGALIALPLLAVFTVLFVRADAAFENLFTGLLQINVMHHLAPVALGTWLAGSYLRGVLVPQSVAGSPIPQGVSPRSSFRLGAMELNVALGLVNLLFAIFVLVQAQYFFGNARLVETTPGMTYSSYARRGFFELVTVALLVLPLLLAGDTAHAADQSKRWFRAQSCALVCLVYCVMASALLRMRLYQQEYGLTELRWYTTAFMFWLAVVFALFCLTVLRDLRGLFAMGTVASALAGIFVLHVVNPDRWIATANIANAEAGRRFDATYFRFLSADAAPAVLASGVIFRPEERSAYITHLQERLAATSDWRAWNYGRHVAQAALTK